ncbi:hypothetical protein WUBG_11485, partial [Wuchereria bancrofti]
MSKLRNFTEAMCSLLLGYLPVERQQWSVYLQKQREIYNSLVEDVIVHPGQSSMEQDHETTVDH